MYSLARSSAGIFLVSLGMLTVEISLTRIFSYAISYHFAYLTIATALLGFGAAGVLLTAYPRLWGGEQPRLVGAACGAAVSTVAVLGVSSVLRFNPVALGGDVTALSILLVYYLVVTVPFLMGGLVVATILSARPSAVSRLYAWDLLGAALGCGLAVPLIWAVGTPAAVVLGAVVLALSALVFAGGEPAGRRLSWTALAATLSVGAAVLFWGPFPPSPGKFLSYFLATPGVEHLYERWTPLSRVDAVGWDRSEGSWRGAYAVSGVSPTFKGRGPEYRMIGYDGGSFAVMYQWGGSDAELEVFRHHVMATPYKILDAPRVLIIGLGGGADALAGVANGAGPMTGLELNPITVDLGRADYADFNGGLFDSDVLEVETAEARHWIESSDREFDLIVLNSIDTLSALSSGAYVLAESYLYTVEAFRSYLEHLGPGGVYSLFSFDNNGLAGPTFIILRFASTLDAALRALGAEDPKRHMAIIASTEETPLVNTLVKRVPFTGAEVEALEDFVEREGFVFWHRPDRPTDHQVASYLALEETERKDFLDGHYLRLGAVTDASPFFFNFYKWSSLLVPHSDDSGTTPSTGQRMLMVMLVQALMVSAALIFWPLARLRKSRPVGGALGPVVYFSALGLGFILIEISLMQRFVLFLGFPTYSLSVVLFSLLTFTGLGSAFSARLGPPFSRKPAAALAVLALAVAVFLSVSPGLFERLLDRPLGLRVVVSVAMIAPLGLVLGIFFPLGIRTIESLDRRLVAWAWAVNGFATVIGTIIAVMAAIVWGFSAVMLGALGVYLAGVAALSLSTPRST